MAAASYRRFSLCSVRSTTTGHHHDHRLFRLQRHRYGSLHAAGDRALLESKTSSSPDWKTRRFDNSRPRRHQPTLQTAAQKHGSNSAGKEPPWHRNAKGPAVEILLTSSDTRPDPLFSSLHVDTDLDQWCIRLLSANASEEIGNRPNRAEPRVKKRRPQPHDAMTKPRTEYKKAYR